MQTQKSVNHVNPILNERLPGRGLLVFGTSENLNTSLTYRKCAGCYFSGGKKSTGLYTIINKMPSVPVFLLKKGLNLQK